MITFFKHLYVMYVEDEEGLGTLEILLIIAVLVGIAILFRGYITEWVTGLLNRTGNEINNF